MAPLSFTIEIAPDNIQRLYTKQVMNTERICT